MTVGIIGIGHVGTIMTQLFPNALKYDVNQDYNTQDEINQCDISFICVPTPMSANGACDTTIVEQVLKWVTTPIIVLRSTVPVGFTDLQSQLLQKHIVFQPEYYGETINHRFANPYNRSWITLGGHTEDCEKIVELYQTVFTSELIINIVDAKTAELAKYMENCFYATKVTFCNQFYDLAKALKVDYTQLRETWLLDPRISRDHTFVYPHERGYGGSCLPKDLAATIAQGEQTNVNVDFLRQVQTTNLLYRGLV